MMRALRPGWLTYLLLLLLPLGCLLLAGGLVAHLQIQHRIQHLAILSADFIDQRLANLETQLAPLRDPTRPPCSPDALLLMRELVYRNALIRDIQIEQHQQLLCAALGTKLTDASLWGPADTADGIWHSRIPATPSGQPALLTLTSILSPPFQIHVLIDPAGLVAPELLQTNLPIQWQLGQLQASSKLLRMNAQQEWQTLSYRQSRVSEPSYRAQALAKTLPFNVQLLVESRFFFHYWWPLQLKILGLLTLVGCLPFLYWQYRKRTHGPLGNAISSEVARAIRHHEFFIQYLPTVDNRTGNCIGAEALIRWQHPRQGMMMPDIFIPMAERTGMIVPMTEWLVERMALEMGAWLRTHRQCYISINVSAAHFHAPQFLDKTQRILQRHQIEADQLVLEITERELIDAHEQTTLDVLQQATHYGFRLAIDDFGTGYNNLARLYEFGFELIKLDRSLMRTALDKEGGARVFDAVLTVANGYGAPVLVEGVEYAHDLAFVAQRPIHSLQGWYFSRPVGYQEFLTFFRQRTPDLTTTSAPRDPMRGMQTELVS